MSNLHVSLQITKAMFFVSRISETGVISVYFDTRKPHIVLPPDLSAESLLKQKRSPILSLDYGLALPIAIPSIEVNDAGIRAMLSFRGTPFDTFVPWDAVFAMQGGSDEAIIHLDEPPPELAAPKPPPKPQIPALKSVKSSKKPSPFTLIKGGQE
jgi:hypothetical protein